MICIEAVHTGYIPVLQEYNIPVVVPLGLKKTVGEIKTFWNLNQSEGKTSNRVFRGFQTLVQENDR